MLELLFGKKREKRTLHSEHLKRGIRPVMAAILTQEDSGSSYKFIKRARTFGQFANYYGKPEQLRKKKMLNGGEYSYTISNISSADKWSTRYWNCTGIVAVGRKKGSRREISFLTHQDPGFFLSEGKEQFKKDLIKQIQNLKEKTKEGTLDVVIFGGQSYSQSYAQQHEDSIRFLTEICKDNFGFEPVVLTGPSKNGTAPTSAFFNTQKRRLFLVRPQQPKDELNESYAPGQIDEQKRKWTLQRD